jgi:hypothetical protein
MGLSIRGLFGPMLVGVTKDIVESKVGWSRWEQSDAGALAVFRFSVDKEGSTYYVKWCCYQRPQGGMNEYEAVPPYSGEIAIEPSTGKVLRIAIVGELGDKAPISKAGIVLEYGDVEIAGKVYFLPVKGVSFNVTKATRVASWTQNDFSITSAVDKYKVTAVNDMRFDHYQVYRGDVRIVPNSMDEAPEK